MCFECLGGVKDVPKGNGEGSAVISGRTSIEEPGTETAGDTEGAVDTAGAVEGVVDAVPDELPEEVTQCPETGSLTMDL